MEVDGSTDMRVAQGPRRVEMIVRPETEADVY